MPDGLLFNIANWTGLTSMSNSKKKYFTVLVVPHSEEQAISFRVPLFMIQLLCVVLSMLIIGVFILARGYITAREKTEEVDILMEINRKQKEQIDLLARETENLLLQVQRLDDLQEEIVSLVDEDIALREKHDQNKEADLEKKPLASLQLASRGDNLVINRMANNISTLQGELPSKLKELEQLKGAVEDYRKKLAHTPSIRPAQGKLSSPFGPRISPISGRREFHTGLDIANSTGTPIFAAANGRVVAAEYSKGWGYYIMIDHGYGYRTKYAHLSSLAVKVGDQVEKGQLIGRMGNTGYSTGSHLHYEVHLSGIPVNPSDYIN